MVSVKERAISGRKYTYISATASYKGKKQRFERSLGLSDQPETELTQKIEHFTKVLTERKHWCEILLETERQIFHDLHGGYGLPLTIIRRSYDRHLRETDLEQQKKFLNDQFYKYVHHTTALEGNRISSRNTIMILKDGVSPQGTPLKDIHEVNNYTGVRQYLDSYNGDVNRKFILKLHYLIMRNVDDDSAGTFRKDRVYIEGSAFAPPPSFEIDDLLDELLDWYKANKEILHPLELAVLLHHRFLQIHPFIDGNGRVAREMLNFVVRRNGYPDVIVPNGRRDEYISALEEADNDDLAPLMELMANVMLSEYFDIFDEHLSIDHGPNIRAFMVLIMNHVLKRSKEDKTALLDQSQDMEEWLWIYVNSKIK